ncbi:LptF/LptG family permease [bacterium]|nr:LptF/LptG family permease [bacterium]
MPTSLLSRLVFFDLIKITLLTLTGMSGLFVVTQAMVEAGKLGIEPIRIVMMLPYLIPPTLPYTMPVSILFAVTFVYSRMSGNQEIVAMKAGGIHVLRIIQPAILWGIVCSGVGIYLADQMIPTCHRKVTQSILDDLETSILSYLRQTGEICKPDFPYEIFVKEVRDDRLINATFKHRAPNGKYDFMAQAEEATLDVVPASATVPAEGPSIRLRLLNHHVLSTEGRGFFQDQTYPMPVPVHLAKAELKTESYSSRECQKEAGRYRQTAVYADFDLATSGAWSLLKGDPTPFSSMVTENRSYSVRQVRKSRELDAEVHCRLAQAVAALTFVLVGCPIGILFQKRDFLQTFFVCFLPIVTIYYPALILSQNLVKEGLVVDWISVWSPTVLMILLSIPLYRQVIRH